MAVTTTQVQQLYLAYFGRPAEQAGLTYWTSQANASVTDISAAFAQSPEYTGVYGNLTRAQTIDTLYQNLFGRTAANNELTYWQNSTDVSISNLALALVNGATGTDRLLLDSKAQYAASITATAGTSASAQAVSQTFKAAGTDVIINGTTYTDLATYLATGTAANPVSASTYYTAAAVAQGAATSPVFNSGTLSNGQTAFSGTTAANFGSLTAGTVSFVNANADTALTLTGTEATSVTVQGTFAASTSALAAGRPDLSFVADATATQFSTLNVNVSSAGTTDATKVVGVDISGLTELTAVNAASSSANLVISGTDAVTLSSITGGSGSDVITVAPTAATAVALTVDGGAGNDTINATAGNNATLTLNGGAGNDIINVTTNATATLGNVIVNGGAGNDTINLSAVGVTATTGSHNVTITLGDGNDTLAVAALSNLNGTFTTGTAAQITAANTAIAADLVKVTDFSASNDLLNMAGITGTTFQALNNTQTATVTSAATLAEAVAAASTAVGASHATSFAFGGNTYVYVNDATAGLSSGDGLIELTGFTGQLSSANFVGTTA
ncbi:DUF4214 domain-containing protein [uncultured Pseudomonas sp.]|uniref:beta strand repeat-containing protein n=1 Tax=uncultured Pseudomonas sp. TaxID=114707 RepID=UPI002590FD68|nr:DUF4214 domain-containing protein [uncultured Pseudomonas sp.]